MYDAGNKSTGISMKLLPPYFLLNLLLTSLSLAGMPVYAAEKESEQNTVEIREWLVPWEKSRPRDPYVDRKGRVWFCGQTGNYIARFEPKTEKFEKFDLGEGAGPHNLIVDSAGQVWFAGNLQGYIGRLDPETGEIKKYPMPEGITDPHTLEFDSQGDIWFTAQFSNAVGKLTVETGEIKIIPMQTAASRPYGIKVDSKDRPWIVLFGTNKIATISPKTFKLREFELPRKEIRPRRLAITSYDKIWIVDHATGTLGRFDPVTANYTERQLPGGAGSEPYAMAVDNRDWLWLVETGSNPNRFIGFDPWKQEFSMMADIPSGGGSVRHMYFHRKNRSIWFGTDTNFIGRAKLP